MSITKGIRLNESELESIKQKAEKHQLSIGKFIKAAALENEIKVKATNPDLIRELGRIGNNLNQIAKALNILRFNDNARIGTRQFDMVVQHINDLQATISNRVNSL